jgi:hypothetical protein
MGGGAVRRIPELSYMLLSLLHGVYWQWMSLKRSDKKKELSELRTLWHVLKGQTLPTGGLPDPAPSEEKAKFDNLGYAALVNSPPHTHTQSLVASFLVLIPFVHRPYTSTRTRTPHTYTPTGRPQRSGADLCTGEVGGQPVEDTKGIPQHYAASPSHRHPPQGTTPPPQIWGWGFAVLCILIRRGFSGLP